MRRMTRETDEYPCTDGRPRKIADSSLLLIGQRFTLWRRLA
jgi:hypothetical protein